jgi:hypothetical protein
MKKLTILLVIIAFMSSAMCQNDTTSKTDSLTAEDKLFQGTYEVDNDRAVSPVFCFSKFTKVKKVKYSAHCNGLFAGFSNLATRDLSEIGIMENAELKLSSFEIGFTFIGMTVNFSQQYGWLFYTGLGFKVQQYNADRNYAFKEVDDITVQVHPLEEGRYYSKSRLVQWYMHLPIMCEYQKKIKAKNNFFIQAGLELGIKLSSKSSVVYRDDRNKRVREKLGTKMNVNPLTVDAKMEIGFNHFGLYARYGLIDIFRKGRGPEAIPVAAGVVWHF